MKLNLVNMISLIVALSFMTSAYADKAEPLIPSEVINQYSAAAKGDSDANEKAHEELTKLHKRYPNSALINAVLGSAEAMRARDSFIPWRQLKYLEKGMALIDKGINLLQPNDHVRKFEGIPVSLWVRNTAGCTFIEVPEMFNRLEIGYEILKKTIISKEVARLPFSQKASTYLCAGIAAEKMGEKQVAREYLEAITRELPPEDSTVKEARSILRKL
ncbi:MAG: hypothetical protein OQJ89_14425 [Kangiellaceae bacterium]|nr:hypothetical protein [Kangiellaceae bacterium]MCW9018162.1 hypothetical protein [Kangiellaceae bacterium]